MAFSGAKHEREHTDIYSSCRLIVRKNVLKFITVPRWIIR
ncbi:hypothetical protein [Escherichia coli]